MIEEEEDDDDDDNDDEVFNNKYCGDSINSFFKMLSVIDELLKEQ